MAAGLTVAGCTNGLSSAFPATASTNSAVALANLDHLIAQQAGDPGSVDLLLLRAQCLSDAGALDEAALLTESAAGSVTDLLRRARARAAAHRFADALADVDAATALDGASAAAVFQRRASLLVAMGRSTEVLPALQQAAAQRPGFDTHSRLALALAAAGRIEEADGAFAKALDELDTTSPFPAASLWFARGLMWSEQAGDSARGEAMFTEALRHLPQCVPVNIHMAELEAARGDAPAAMARLEQVVARSDDAEALALLGALCARQGDAARGQLLIARARLRYEALLSRHPAAFADHAAEFYLGAGDDAARAHHWAEVNLRARETRRAFALAARAARAAGHADEALLLETRMAGRFNRRAA